MFDLSYVVRFICYWCFAVDLCWIWIGFGFGLLCCLICLDTGLFVGVLKCALFWLCLVSVNVGSLF